MKKSLIKSTSQSVMLGLAIITLSACGKNMHIPVGNAPAVKSVDDASKKQAGATTEQAPLVTDKLIPLSKADVQVALKGETKGIRHLGAPSMLSKDGKIGINKDVTLVSRALILVPEEKQIKSIEGFSITLKGLNTLVTKSEEKSKEEICFGMDDKNCIDISEAATKAVGQLEDGSVVKQAEGDLEIDLIKNLKISDKTGDQLRSDVLGWMEKNSLPFAKNGLRKLIVRIRSNTNISDSAVLLQLVNSDSKALDKATAPAETDLVNGKDDLASAEVLSESKVVELKEVTKEEVKSEEDAVADKKVEHKAADETKASSEQSSEQKAQEEALNKKTTDAVAEQKKKSEEAVKAAEAPVNTNVDAAQNSKVVEDAADTNHDGKVSDEEAVAAKKKAANPSQSQEHSEVTAKQ